MATTQRTPKREQDILRVIQASLSCIYSGRKLFANLGHDITHVQRMCKIAERIWPTLQKVHGIREDIQSGCCTMFLLKLAIWMHNIDRIKDTIRPKIKYELSPFGDISPEEILLIEDAVEKHSKREQKGDSSVLRCLRYCDMLDRIGALGIISISAHALDLGGLPYVLEDFKSPGHGAKTSEDLKTAIKALKWVIEWEGFLPKEIQNLSWVKEGFRFTKTFLQECFDQSDELGILE